MTLDRPSGRRPLAVSVDPLPKQAGLGSFGHGVLIRVIDPDALPLPGARARWRALWALTPAEVRLAEAMITCDCDLRAASVALGVSYGTVRTQLASIFLKTGTNGQPQLMRLLARVTG